MREWVGDCFDAEQFDPSRVKFDSPKQRWRIGESGDSLLISLRGKRR
jgi:hypothetical protein